MDEVGATLGSALPIEWVGRALQPYPEVMPYIDMLDGETEAQVMELAAQVAAKLGANGF